MLHVRENTAVQGSSVQSALLSVNGDCWKGEKANKGSGEIWCSTGAAPQGARLGLGPKGSTSILSHERKKPDRSTGKGWSVLNEGGLPILISVPDRKAPGALLNTLHLPSEEMLLAFWEAYMENVFYPNSFGAGFSSIEHQCH